MFQGNLFKNQEAHLTLCLIFSKTLPNLNTLKYTSEGIKPKCENIISCKTFHEA